MAVDRTKVIELIVEQLDADVENISNDDSFMDDPSHHSRQGLSCISDDKNILFVSGE